MNLFKINTSAWGEEDFLLVTELTKKEISKVIKPMVREERWFNTLYSNEDYVARLTKAYPKKLIQMHQSPDKLKF